MQESEASTTVLETEGYMFVFPITQERDGVGERSRPTLKGWEVSKRCGKSPCT